MRRTRRGCPRHAASETGGCTRAQGAATAQREFRSACRCWRNRKLENGCARRGGVWKGCWDLGSGHASLLSGFATQQPRDRDKAHPPVGLSTWKPEQPGATCLSSRFRVQPSGKQTPLMRPACTRPRPHSLTKSGVLLCARCVTPAGSAEASPGKHRAYHAKSGRRRWPRAVEAQGRDLHGGPEQGCRPGPNGTVLWRFRFVRKSQCWTRAV